MFYDCYVTIEITTMNIKSFIHRYLYLLITPYIKMLHSDWLIAVIFFFTNSGLEFLPHVGVFA